MRPLLKVENLYKKFSLIRGRGYSVKSFFVQPFKRLPRETFVALDHVNLEINTGEFIGLIGHNGSGKSTLLKIISGIYDQDGGEMDLNGKLVPFLELGVGFNPDLSVRDNVYLNGTILGMTKSYLVEKLQEIIEFAELEKFLDTPLKNLSSGMRVRLAFAIAIMSKADLYLWDEVLAVGDIHFQEKAQQVFRDMKSQGTSVLLVSHDMDEIREFSDRVIWLDGGKVRMEGDAQEVVDAYERTLYGS